MTSSGVKTLDDVTKAYNELKLGHKYRYVIFCLKEGDTKIGVESCAPPEATFDDFVAALPEREGRYAVYDMEYDIEDKNLGSDVTSRKASSIIFFVWIPDTCKIKTKMIMASSKDELKKQLTGLNIEIQATELGELNLEDVIVSCKSKKR
jgi:cofilin